MNENEFRKFLIASIEADRSVHLVNIPDEIKGILHLHPELASRIMLKPYDMGILHKGKYYGLELKNESKNLTWNLNKVEDHQVKYLKEVDKCGGRGLILVRFKRAVNIKEKQRLGLTARQWAIDTTFVLPIRELLATKLTSFSYEYLQENFDVLEFNKVTKKYNLDAIWKTRTKKP